MKREFKILVLGSGAWLLFVILLKMLPHYESENIGFINEFISFLGFIIAMRLVILRGRPSLAYLFFGLFLFNYSAFHIYLFIGSQGIIGDDYIKLYVYEYLMLSKTFFLGMTVIFSVIYYLFNHLKQKHVLLISAAIFLPVWFFFSRQILLDKYYLVTVQSYNPLYISMLKIGVFLSVMLVLFWWKVFRTDHLVTQHLNSLMLGFTFFLPMDILHYIFYISDVNRFHKMSQYWGMAVMLFFVVSLLFKLHSLVGEFGPIYERIILRPAKRFTRRRGYFDRFIVWCFLGEEEEERALFIQSESRN